MRNRIQRYFDRRKVIKAVGSFDEAGLIRAVVESKYEALEILIHYGISPAACDEAGSPALSLAVLHRQMLSLGILIRQKIPLDQTDREGRTALHLAIQQDDKHSFHQLLEAGANPNLCLPDGRTPLMLGAQSSSVHFVRELIDAGIEVNQSDHNGKVALMYAVEKQRTAALKALLDAGANPTLRDSHGRKASEMEGLSPRIYELLKEAESRFLKEKLPPLNQKLAALFGGLMEGTLNSLNQSDSLTELEQKGKELITSLTSDEQLAQWLGKLEETALQEEIKWWLNLLVELREILSLQQQALHTRDWETADAPRNWQKQLLWLVSDYRENLESYLAGQHPIPEKPAS